MKRTFRHEKTRYDPLFTVFCTNLHGAIPKGKAEKIDFLKFEMQQLRDSSEHYFDKAIKLFEEGETPAKIKALISPQLTKYEAEIDQKLTDFKNTAEKLKFTEAEIETIFQELKEIFKNVREKYEYLEENGVKI